MPNESNDELLLTQSGSRPVPDPTKLTTDAVNAAADQWRRELLATVRVFETRLDAMDKAQEIHRSFADDAIKNIPDQVRHLRQLHTEKFGSIQTQFTERDTRQERESRDNKVAVDAAFAAQKEAAAKQDESNQKAIDKSEKATNETIKTNAELFKTTTDGLREQINDLKDRLANTEAGQVNRISAVENRITAAQSLKEGGRDQLTAIYALVGFFLALLSIGGFLAATGVFSK